MLWKKPLVMGIVNVTPDSFSDGGRYQCLDNAIDHAVKLIEQGADIIDVGGESTKPGAEEVSLADEFARVIPVIRELRTRTDVTISIDTSKPQVMEQAIAAGATMINDVFALQKDGALEVACSAEVPVCLMHMQGQPRSMQHNPSYPNGVVSEVKHFLEERVNACLDAGLQRSQLILDPGFGFGKTVADNLLLMNQLDVFHVLGLPLMIGVSRKSTLGAVMSQNVEERLIPGIALAVYAALKNVSIIRTHDVDETQQALAMIDAVEQHSAY